VRSGPDAAAIVRFARALVAAPSPSGSEGAVARRTEEEMRGLGYSVEVDDWGNVVGSLGSPGGPCVLLDAHMDTVGVTNPDEWAHDPGGELSDGRLYGRGAMDMKGPLAAAVHGVASLAGSLESARVVVCASVAEELVEGPALAHVLDLVEPEFVVVCEATSLKIARGQRGRAEISVEVLGRTTHSSRPDLGVNAADAMASVLVALRRFEPPEHPVLGKGILVPTDVRSEPYPALSVVPDYCAATLDRRTLPGEAAADVLAPLRRHAEGALANSGARLRLSVAKDDFETYTGSRVTASNFAPAWFFEEDALVVSESLQALAEAGIPSGLSHYSFCTNGSASAGVRGIPTVGFGPGDERLAHRVDEHVEVTELGRAARGYAAIAARLASHLSAKHE
jgi:putative selenium metabolism hydrolase